MKFTQDFRSLLQRSSLESPSQFFFCSEVPQTLWVCFFSMISNFFPPSHFEKSRIFFFSPWFGHFSTPRGFWLQILEHRAPNYSCRPETIRLATLNWLQVCKGPDTPTCHHRTSGDEIRLVPRLKLQLNTLQRLKLSLAFFGCVRPPGGESLKLSLKKRNRKTSDCGCSITVVMIIFTLLFWGDVDGK